MILSCRVYRESFDLQLHGCDCGCRAFECRYITVRWSSPFRKEIACYVPTSTHSTPDTTRPIW